VEEPLDVVWRRTHTGEGLVLVRSLRNGGSTLEDQYGSSWLGSTGAHLLGGVVQCHLNSLAEPYDSDTTTLENCAPRRRRSKYEPG